jgi:hypothetical protein
MIKSRRAGKRRNACRIFIRKPEGKRPPERHRSERKILKWS